MPHPHRSAAKSTNANKMRAITGKGGAGSSFMAGSPFKRANKHGEQESYNSKSKGFESGYAHGGAVKARGDRRARGGALHGVKKVGTKGETHAKGAPGVEDSWGGGKQPAPTPLKPVYESNKKGLAGATPGHFARGGKAKHKGDVNIVIMQPHKSPAPGGLPGGPPPGGPPGGAGLTGAASPTPPPAGGGASPMAGGAPPNPQAMAALQGLAGGSMGMGGMGGLGAGLKADGGRIKKQMGGAAYPMQGQDPRLKYIGPPAGAAYSRQFSGPPPTGAMGGPPQGTRPSPPPLPSGAGALPPPPSSEDSNREFSGEPGGSGNAKGGRTSFKFKKGGATWTATRDGMARGGRLVDQGGNKGGRGDGVMPQKESHWADYSNRNRKSKAGGSGESEELTLANSERKVGDLKKADQRARGGRLGTTSKRKGGLPGAGQQTGEARLQQYRKGNF